MSIRLTQLVRDVGLAGPGLRVPGITAQVLLKSLGDEGQAALRFEFPARLVERVVQVG